MSEERSGDSQGSTVTSPPSSEAPQTSSPQEEQPSPPEEEKNPPYNLWFAWTVLAVAIVAYALTMLLFRGLFEDPAVVTGSLGALFTLLGTVAGAYFGVSRVAATRLTELKSKWMRRTLEQRGQTRARRRPYSR